MSQSLERDLRSAIIHTFETASVIALNPGLHW